MISSSDQQHGSRPVAFFASRLEKQKKLREEVFKLGERIGREIWVSEHSNEALNKAHLDQVHVACLRMIRESQSFICVLDGTYGNSWNASEISMLETELFMAAAARKPIRIFLLDPLAMDPRLTSMLDLISRACPGALDSSPKSAPQILEQIDRMLSRNARVGIVHKLAGYITQHLALARSLHFRETNMNLEVRYLDGQFFPLYTRTPDRELVQQLISDSDKDPVHANRLAQLWMAIRHLSGSPFNGIEADPQLLQLWEDTLRRWSSSASWFGLHNHMYLGALATLNSLREIRERSAQLSGSQVDVARTMNGAFASVYYSIAKTIPSFYVRRAVRLRALDYVNRGLAGHEEIDSAGLLTIRGSLYLSLWRVDDAVVDFRNAFEMRSERTNDPGSLGELEVNLGMALFRKGQVLQGKKLLERGVANLEASGRTPFAVSAMRKLCLYYACTFRRREARDVLDRAEELARSLTLDGQLRQMDGLRFFLGRR